MLALGALRAGALSLALAPVAFKPRPLHVGRHRLVVLLGHLRIGARGDPLAQPGGKPRVVALACALADTGEGLLEPVQVRADVLELPEVRRADGLRAPRTNGCYRPAPGVEVDGGGRRRGQHRAAVDAYARH